MRRSIMRKGFTRKIEPIRVLSDLQVEELHKAALEILETTGVKYESKRALKLFEESGCIVDHESRIVKFPGYLVEECIRMAPSSFRVKGKFPEDDMRIGGNTLYFMPAAGAKLHDEKTGELSVATLDENNTSKNFQIKKQEDMFYPLLLMNLPVRKQIESS